jgi:hypothetical protein
MLCSTVYLLCLHNSAYSRITGLYNWPLRCSAARLIYAVETFERKTPFNLKGCDLHRLDFLNNISHSPRTVFKTITTHSAYFYLFLNMYIYLCILNCELLNRAYLYINNFHVILGVIYTIKVCANTALGCFIHPENCHLYGDG